MDPHNATQSSFSQSLEILLPVKREVHKKRRKPNSALPPITLSGIVSVRLWEGCQWEAGHRLSGTPVV